MASVSVLVAVTGDTESRAGTIRRTIEPLVDGNDLAVHVLHVYSESDIDEIESMYDIDPKDSRGLDAAAEHNTAVRSAVDELEGLDGDPVIHGAVGDPGDEIVNLASKLGVDYTMVLGRKRSPTGKALFGSTAQEVLLNAPSPVIYVGSNVDA